MFAALVRRGVGAVARDRTATASIFDISRVVTTGASNPTHAAAALSQPYRRYLMNVLRKATPFREVPIKLLVRGRQDTDPKPRSGAD